MRVLLAICATLAVTLVFILAAASTDRTFLAEHTLAILAANGVAALVLLALVATQLRRLLREYRAGVFGARLKARLLAMLALMAILPGALVYAVSMQFAVQSIDSWFDVRVEAALGGGLDLGRSVLDTMRDDLLGKSRTMAHELADTPVPTSVLLNRLREQAGVRSAALLTVSGRLVASSHADLHDWLPVIPAVASLRQARQGGGFSTIEDESASGLAVRALVPVPSPRLGADPLILFLEQPVAQSIVESATLVEEAWRDYQQIELGRAGLKQLYTLTLTFTLLLALFAAVGLAFFLAARLAKPLLAVVEGTRAVAAGDFSARAGAEMGAGLGELGVLTRSFNEMTAQLDQARREREAAQASMLAAQRAAAWGEVARRLAHEIKNPLTPIQLSAERLEMKLAGKLAPEDSAMLSRATRTIVDQVAAMKHMVDDFRDYARLPPPTPVALDLNALVSEVLELYVGSPVPVLADLDPALPPVQADPDQIRQVLHNLIKNASEAMAEKPGADKTACIEVSTRGGHQQATLLVADRGPGFPPHMLQSAFDPYVTTKIKGTGLGLAIVKKIVDDHGGSVTLENRASEGGSGARVSIQLPIQ